QLNYIWVYLINEHKKNKPPVHIRTYLIRMSPWLIRDYLRKEARKKYFETSKEINLDNDIYLEPDKEFDLGPKFVIYGTNIFPYSMLSNYDRVLLHLRFYEDKSVSEIGRLLQKYRTVVKKDIDDILNYLRSY